MTWSPSVVLTPEVQAWSVTVVIPAADAESSLALTLDALTTLEVPGGGSYEIVVSDDGSTDATVEVASRYPDRVRVVRGAWSGPSGARNRGAATATGEVLAFVDSGDIPCDWWLRQIVETFADPSVGLASWPAWLVDVRLDREQLHKPGPGPTSVAALATCFAMRRRVFDAVGGYDTALRCGENADLCERAAAHCVSAGYRIVQAEQAAAARHTRPATRVLRPSATRRRGAPAGARCRASRRESAQESSAQRDRGGQRGPLSGVVAGAGARLVGAAVWSESSRPRQAHRHVDPAPGAEIVVRRREARPHRPSLTGSMRRSIGPTAGTHRRRKAAELWRAGGSSSSSACHPAANVKVGSRRLGTNGIAVAALVRTPPHDVSKRTRRPTGGS